MRVHSSLRLATPSASYTRRIRRYIDRSETSTARSSRSGGPSPRPGPVRGACPAAPAPRRRARSPAPPRRRARGRPTRAGRAGRRRPRRAGAAAPAGPGTTRRAAPGRTGRLPGRGPRGAVPAGEWYDEQIRGTCRFPSSADSRRPLRARGPEARPAGRTREPYSVRRIPKTSARSPICCRCMAVEGKWPSRAPAPRTAWPPCRGPLGVEPGRRPYSAHLPARFPWFSGRPGFRPGGPVSAARHAPAEKPPAIHPRLRRAARTAVRTAPPPAALPCRRAGTPGPPRSSRPSRRR